MSKCSTFCAFAAFILHYLTVASTLDPHWRNISIQRNVDPVKEYQGLWMDCSVRSRTRTRCFIQNKSLLDLPAFLLYQRTLNTAACIISFVAYITAFSSLDFVNLIKPKNKRKIKILSAVFLLTSGAMLLTSVSLEIKHIVEMRMQASLTLTAYWFGHMVYIGLITGLVEIIIGLIMMKMSCLFECDDDNPIKSHISNQKKIILDEYV